MNPIEKEKQFIQLLENHREQVYRMCWGFANQAAEVDDLFQEVMIRLWKGLEKFEGRSALSTWIYRITVNTCLYWKEKNKKSQWLPIEEQRNIGTSQNRETQIIKNEKLEALRSAIRQLNKADKTIALLLLEELSYKEIAEVTGLTVNNIGVKIKRIKERIKRKLNVQS